MKKYADGKYIEMTTEEVAEFKKLLRQEAIKKQSEPRTVEEGLIELNRTLVTEKIADSEDKTLGIACMALFESWTPNQYEVGDIRTDPATGYPYECIIAHDSTVNTDWTIDVRTLWKPYHSRKKEYALPFEAPTGSHDMYKSGEYMIWDSEIYLCKDDTSYSPEDYPDAWEKME